MCEKVVEVATEADDLKPTPLPRANASTENQIITAEEKRGILKLQAEEQNKREALIREGLKALMEDKLAQSGSRE